MYYIITPLSSSSVAVPEGGTVLASGSFGEAELVPAATTDSDYTAETITIEGADTTLSVDVPNGRRLTGQPSSDFADATGVTPWHDALSMESSSGMLSGLGVHGDWQGGVSHR